MRRVLMNLVNSIKKFFIREEPIADYTGPVPADMIPNDYIPDCVMEHNMVILNCGFNKKYQTFVVCGYTLDKEVEV